MKKKNTYKLLLILVFTIIIISFNQFNIKDNKSMGKESLILNGPIIIDEVPVKEMTYDDVINHFGEPRENKIVKAVFPLDSYRYLYVLIYDDIEIEFYTDKTNNSIPDKQRKVFRFDLTSNKYNIGELRVGMSIDEYLEKFGDTKMYSMTDLTKFSLSNSTYSGLDQQNLAALTRLLIISKPENYYSEYEYIFYEQGIVNDNSPMGLALLIKENKIDRIVYGYPNAS